MFIFEVTVFFAYKVVIIILFACLLLKYCLCRGKFYSVRFGWFPSVEMKICALKCFFLFKHIKDRITPQKTECFIMNDNDTPIFKNGLKDVVDENKLIRLCHGFSKSISY